MAKKVQKSKMTIDNLAQITQGDFLNMDKKIDDIREHMATKEDLNLFATKDDIKGLKEEVVDEVRKENVKVIQSNDKVVTKLDLLLVEEAARTEQHKRQYKDVAFIKQKVGI